MSLDLRPGLAIHAASSKVRIPTFFTILLVTLFAADLVSGTCYELNGEPHAKIRSDDGDWIACDSLAQLSSCCSSKDYCMGNGLCLDAGANNYFSIQGCTDTSWPQPCLSTPECVDNIRDGYSFAFSCRQHTNASFYHCCGQTAACCDTTSQDDLLRIPGVTEIFRPTLLPSGTDGVSTVTVTVTATPSSAFAAESSQSGSDNTRTLEIGVGAGSVLGLALIAALAFFGCQMRQKYKWDLYGHGVTISAAAAAAAIPPAERRVAPAPEPEKSPVSAMTAVTTSPMSHQSHPGHMSYTGSQTSQGSPYQPQYTATASPSTTPVPATGFNYSPQAPAPGGPPSIYQPGQGSYQMGHNSGYPSAGQGQPEIHELGPQQ